MALVIEQINRSGHPLSIMRQASNQVVIGRGFNQDIILDDEFVDASHAKIILDPATGELTCIDLASTNGLHIEPLVGKKRVVLGSGKFVSGDILMVGRTRLRVLRDDHVVPPARKLTLSHRLVHHVSVWPSALVLMLVMLSIEVYQSYIHLPVAENFKHYLLQAGYSGFGVVVLAGFWALIGRALRGDGRWISHLLIALLVGLSLALFEFISPWLAYHLHWPAGFDFISRLILGGVGCTYIYASLRAATKLGILPSALLGALIPTALIINLLIDSLGQQDNVNQVPYLKVLVPPGANLRPVISSGQYVDQTNHLFELPVSAASEVVESEVEASEAEASKDSSPDS